DVGERRRTRARDRAGGGQGAGGKGNRSSPAHQDSQEPGDGGDERERQDQDRPRHHTSLFLSIPRGHSGMPFSSRPRNPSSSTCLTPNSFALSSLEPGSRPATT